jgi:hypothetical protein
VNIHTQVLRLVKGLLEGLTAREQRLVLMRLLDTDIKGSGTVSFMELLKSMAAVPRRVTPAAAPPRGEGGGGAGMWVLEPLTYNGRQYLLDPADGKVSEIK